MVDQLYITTTDITLNDVMEDYKPNQVIGILDTRLRRKGKHCGTSRGPKAAVGPIAEIREIVHTDCEEDRHVLNIWFKKTDKRPKVYKFKTGGIADVWSHSMLLSDTPSNEYKISLYSNMDRFKMMVKEIDKEYLNHPTRYIAGKETRQLKKFLHRCNDFSF